MNFKIFSILTLIILAAIFITQNVTISRALLIVINLLIGFLLGWFIKSYTGYKKVKENKPAKKEVPDSEDL